MDFSQLLRDSLDVANQSNDLSKEQQKSATSPEEGEVFESSNQQITHDPETPTQRPC